MTVKQTQSEVTLISKPPKDLAAMAGKLCYAEDVSTIYVSEEEADKFTNMLNDIGHESPLEHMNFTFLIRGVSRSLTHQLVRHRIASYSQRSQRYVSDFDFKYVAPIEISKRVVAGRVFQRSMKDALNKYTVLYSLLYFSYVNYRLKSIFLSTIFAKEIINSLEDALKVIEHFEILAENYDNPPSNEFCHHNLEKIDLMVQPFLTEKELDGLKKKAQENARAVLPNAAASDIIVTMNARALKHFFEERLCFRAQEEIRDVALKMNNVLVSEGYKLFKKTGPKCVRLGYCPESSKCCGYMPTKKEVLNG